MITNFKITVEDVFNQVSAVCGVSIMNMQIKGRRSEVVRAKRMFCAVLRQNTGMTFSEIGRHINQDHATVIHHVKKHYTSLGKNKKGNFIDVEYAERFKEVDDILNERIKTTHNHFLFTYRIQLTDKRSVLLPGSLKGFVRIIKQTDTEMVFECVAATFNHALMTMSIREIFVDRDLIKIEKV
tara:strand:+ start:12983 stop:13531 length:549 start_codon:yes stop_codon:yes gene_type:complete